MATDTNSNNTDKQLQFLDKTGLSYLWSLIINKFTKITDFENLDAKLQSHIDSIENKQIGQDYDENTGNLILITNHNHYNESNN